MQEVDRDRDCRTTAPPTTLWRRTSEEPDLHCGGVSGGGRDFPEEGFSTGRSNLVYFQIDQLSRKCPAISKDLC